MDLSSFEFEFFSDDEDVSEYLLSFDFDAFTPFPTLELCGC